MKKAVTDGKAKTAVEWAEYYGGQSPGPGEYDVVRKPNWKPEAAGKFGRGKLPISDIDRRVKEGVPGPGQYDLLGYLARQKSGESCVKMAKGRMMKSDIDWKVCYAKGQPGPCHYAINDEVTSRVKGGRFSKGTVKSDIDWKVLAAREGSPGPGAYVTGSSTSLTKGSRISKSERWQYNQLQQQQQQQQQQKQKQQRQRQQKGGNGPAIPMGVEEEHDSDPHRSPGPGAYSNAAPSSFTFKTSRKLAAPGYANVGFSSTATRFRRSAKATAQQALAGPGSYSLPTMAGDLQKKLVGLRDDMTSLSDAFQQGAVELEELDLTGNKLSLQGIKKSPHLSS